MFDITNLSLPVLKDFLPKGYQYHVCRCKAVSQSCGGFEAMLRLGLQSKEEILLWLKSMPVTWRVLCTRPTKGRKTIFRVRGPGCCWWFCWCWWWVRGFLGPTGY